MRMEAARESVPHMSRLVDRGELDVLEEKRISFGLRRSFHSPRE